MDREAAMVVVEAEAAAATRVAVVKVEAVEKVAKVVAKGAVEADIGACQRTRSHRTMLSATEGEEVAGTVDF